MSSPPHHNIHTHFPLLLLSLLLAPLAATSHPCTHPCTKDFAEEIQKTFNSTRIQSCTQQSLKAEFAWSFDKASRQLDIALGAKLRHETGWLAWGLNPRGPYMEGTRALIGIKNPYGSLQRHTYNVTASTKAKRCPLLPSDHNVGLNITRFRFDYLVGSQYYVITATIMLPDEFNASSTSVVWQIGDAVSGNEPLMHPKYLDNFDSTAIIDLECVEFISPAHPRRNLRIAHGVVNMVGWGALLPSGVIVARYMRVYPKPWAGWYDVHVRCQTAGYIIGSGGWGLGIWLGKTSRYYSFNIHYNLGLLIFICATIQMLAWRLRPAPSDEYRTYWNMYHHFVGYSMLALIWVNIFLGIKIVEAEHVWKWAYIGVLGALGMLALAFELWGWISFILQKTDQTLTAPSST